MMKPNAITLAVLLVGLPAIGANAQVTLDVSKITCKQYRSYEIVNPNDIALWLSGYYNGMKRNTVIKPQTFKQNVSQVNDFCVTNPNMPLMQAVEKVLGENK